MIAGYDYIHDGAEIYARSFAIIRREADLSRFSKDEERVAVRVIHACGMVDVANDLSFSVGFTQAAQAALRAGAPIFCDSQMVANGITKARLPANNEIICTLTSPDIADRAARAGTTRSAVALELWREQLHGALVLIGNAPTALFHLLEMLDAGAPHPAAIIGMPVGFVGAAESKQALMTHGLIPAMTCWGRRGGSAMTVAALNALASEAE